MPRTLRIWNLHGLRSAVLTAAVAGLLVAACGESATPAPESTATPAPSAEADAHLSEPAAASDVFQGLQVAGLALAPNNASGGADREPREVINATYAGWPLSLASFSTGDTLRDISGFQTDVEPGRGAPPYRLVGLNVLVSYGPATDGKVPGSPELRFSSAAQALADALDALIGPLEQSSIEPVRLPVTSLDESAATAPSSVP